MSYSLSLTFYECINAGLRKNESKYLQKNTFDGIMVSTNFTVSGMEKHIAGYFVAVLLCYYTYGKKENRGQRSEVRGQKTEDGDQRSGDGDQKTEVRGEECWNAGILE